MVENDLLYLSHFDKDRKRLRHVGDIEDGPFWVSGGYDEASNSRQGFFYGSYIVEGEIDGKPLESDISATVEPCMSRAPFCLHIPGPVHRLRWHL